MQDAQFRQGAHTGFLSDAHRTRSRSCKAGLKARRERDMRKGRARPAGAAAAGHAGHSSAARPAAAPAAGAAGAAPARSAEQRESASMRLVAEHARDGGDQSAGRLRHRTTGEDVAGTSDGSLAPGTFDSASEPGGAAGDSPRAGGACCLSPAMLSSLRALLSLDSLCLLIAAVRV